MAAGDHIAVLRHWLFHIIQYWHHGIEVDDGMVIHLTGTGKKDAEVTRTSLKEFLKSSTKVIVDYSSFITRLIMHYDIDSPRERLRTTQHIAAFDIPIFGPQLRYDFALPSARHNRSIVRTLQREPAFTSSTIRALEERINDPQRATAEARKHVGEKGYNLLFNNCEHFATFCKTGRQESFQIMELMWRLAPAKSIERGRTVAEAAGLEC